MVNYKKFKVVKGGIHKKMRILLIHLSDAHLKDKTYIDEKIINAQVQAINSLGKFDKCCIAFSGDLAYSGQENEYKKARFYLGNLWRKLTNKFNLIYPINTFVVPGNHDIDFQCQRRNRSEICELINAGITDEMITEELENFHNFYDIAQYYNCFSYNKLIDVKILPVGDKKIQINLINSELFSTYNDENNDDDKGKHFLPESEWNRIARGKDIDLVVTISHRGPEWFSWESANSFKKSLNCNTDLFLYGHEHINDTNLSCQKDNNLIKSIARGIDFHSKDIFFTTLLVDLETDNVVTTLFNWDSENEIFTRNIIENFKIDKAYSQDYLIEPSYDYVKEIAVDDNKFEIQKYFVFPGVEILGQEKYTEIKEFSEFLSLIDTKKQLIIEGDDSSGKTVLLHQIYLSLIGNYIPIYLNDEILINHKPEKAIKQAFEIQFGENVVAYEKFLQADKDRKVVLVDDLNKIKHKFLQPLEEYLNAEFGHIISAVEPKWNIDIIEMAKTQLDESEEISKCRLLPFYSSKRLELITNLIGVYNVNYSDKEKDATQINNFIRDQIKLFSLSPKFINLYVEYCIRETEFASSANKNVFGRVFENNLINDILKFSSQEDLDEYATLLEDVAYTIHFEEKYPLQTTELSTIVDKYNEEHLLKVNVVKFCDVMTKAKILVQEEDGYYFYNNSYLAYFVAKSLNSRYNNGEENGELETILKNICFNINGDILLFLSYITSNLNILRFIITQAEEHMKDWTEFDLDQKNIGFIFRAECPRIDKLPTASDRRKKDEREEHFEKKATQQDKIERVSLYEYNKDDVETEDYKIGQALRLTNLICKMLPGFNHRLKRHEKEIIAKDLFVLPNKIIFKELRWIDENFDEIVTAINEFYKINSEEITEERIKQAIINGAETYILNIYDICARTSVNDRTIDIMDLCDNNNTNYKIQHIIMLENLGRFIAFTGESNKLYDETKLPFIKSMLTRIVYKHFLYNKQLKLTGKVESVAKKYFGKSFKKTDLIK